MRVVFVLPDLPRSGAATRTVHLAERLVGYGDRVTVATFRSPVDGGLAKRLRRSGIDLIRLPGPRGVRRLHRLLDEGSDTVLHAAMPTAGLLGLCVARATRRPIVYTYTNCLHTQRPFRTISVRDRLKALLERVIASRSDALHAVSQAVADQLRHAYPQSADRVHAIPLSVTAPVSDDALAERPESGGAYPTLLCIGRLLPHKRVEDAIRAVASVRIGWPAAMLLVVGSGPESPRLRRLVSGLGLEANVRLVGESSRPGRFFAWANLLVHPSVCEGYPRVFAEARAHDLPVVAADTPHGREYAHAGGRVLLARPADSGSLAEAITAALTREASGRRTSDAHGSADVVRDFRALYRRVLDGGGSPPAQ